MLFSWPVFHWFFFVDIHRYLGINHEPKVYTWSAKKADTAWIFGCALTPSLRPSRRPKWFQFILFSHFMKPPLFQDLLPNFRETNKNWNKNQWKQDTKKTARCILITMISNIKKLSNIYPWVKSQLTHDQNNPWFLFETQCPKPSFRVILKVFLEKSQFQKLTSFGIILPYVGFSGIQIPFFVLKIVIWCNSCT